MKQKSKRLNPRKQWKKNTQVASGRVTCSFLFNISMITWYCFVIELQIFASRRHFFDCSQITRNCSPQDLASTRTDTSSVALNVSAYFTFLTTILFEGNEKPDDSWSPYSDPVEKTSEKQRNASPRTGIHFHCRIDKVLPLVGCLLD